ncbi:DUF1330 domain-containing protein [Vibrio genomosp. F6]|uniref:DUF1330 domain-containing protein n=1 Tax=Vibrio genomosp. F6 str. FF-238 TaxID=1191298 RepID=A0A1E5CWL6_9VIBR|nr:DUF1330 domain-containing protein [Vibrio genomosp. F6]OEE74745.1 hypothetical protein A130_06130 [Vibrio genomosp. F6 str. FF-238]
MTVFFILNYDVSDPEQYSLYNPGSIGITAATIAKHGGEILVATNEGHIVDGEMAQMKVVVQFPNKEAALAWHDDPEYAKVKQIRLNSTTNINSFIVDKLVLPE